MDEEGKTIQEILCLLRKRWKIIFLITLTAAIFSAMISIFVISPKYQVNSKVFIGKENSKVKGEDQNYNDNDVLMYQNLLKTYAGIIETNDLIEEVIDEKSLNLEAQDILKNLKVTPRTDTQILEIQYTNKNGELAKEILNSVITEFIVKSKELIPNGNIKVIESVKTPEKPSSPNIYLNITIALVIGLMVGIGISLILEQMDSTFTNKEQMENSLELPVLGVIPDFDCV